MPFLCPGTDRENKHFCRSGSSRYQHNRADQDSGRIRCPSHIPVLFFRTIRAVVPEFQRHHRSNRAARADTGIFCHNAGCFSCRTEEFFTLLFHAVRVGRADRAGAHVPVFIHHLFPLFRCHCVQFFDHLHESFHGITLSRMDNSIFMELLL